MKLLTEFRRLSELENPGFESPNADLAQAGVLMRAVTLAGGVNDLFIKDGQRIPIT